MFGMGFAEILIIGVIAILFLGPEKLPETMVQIAKFFKSVKTTVASAKSSIEEELHIHEIKEEANSYKRQLTEASSELTRVTGIEDLKDEMRDIKEDAHVQMDAPEPSAPAAPKKPEAVTFAKKSKKLDVETPSENESGTKPSENA
ncbi:MAG: Sec-independent protein translocase protein TatB [Sulfurimonadaceae bacterium]|jgi:sec-independent protein translocase protein TatB